MKSITLLYLILCIILWPVLYIAKYNDYVSWEKVSVPVFVTLVFLYNLYLNPPLDKKKIPLFLAFLFVCIGDYMVNLTSLGAFFIIPFMLVHINLIVCFSVERPWQAKNLPLLLPVLAPGIIIYSLMWERIHSAGQLVVFALYLLLLSTMLWRATVTAASRRPIFNKVMLFCGALFFYITDVSVATNTVLKTQFLVGLTWICYPPALAMLSMMNFPLRKHAVKTGFLNTGEPTFDTTLSPSCDTE